jgi:hypothetical protein
MIGNFPDHEFQEGGYQAIDVDPKGPDAVCYKGFKFEHANGGSVITQCGHTRKEH